MILELDFGNSRIKWRQLSTSDNEVTEEGVVADVSELIGSGLEETRPQGIRCSSVRVKEDIEKLRQWAAVIWGLTPVVAEVARTCSGVTIQYDDVSRLGVDRWLAMLAAFDRARSACVVVDAGTALTVDALDDAGLHLGGYILPGLRLMSQSLQANTGIRLAREEFRANADLGNSTEEAVLQGALASQVAIIEHVLKELTESGGSPRLFLAGGDAPILAEVLEYPARESAAELVLDGLKLACPMQTAADS